MDTQLAPRNRMGNTWMLHRVSFSTLLNCLLSQSRWPAIEESNLIKYSNTILINFKKFQKYLIYELKNKVKTTKT